MNIGEEIKGLKERLKNLGSGIDHSRIWNLLCAMEETEMNYDFESIPLFTDEEWQEMFSHMFMSRDKFVKLHEEDPSYRWPDSFNPELVAEIQALHESRIPNKEKHPKEL